MELGDGLALRAARTKNPHSAEDWHQLRLEFASVCQKISLAAGQITQLEAEGNIFEATLKKYRWGHARNDASTGRIACVRYRDHLSQFVAAVHPTIRHSAEDAGYFGERLAAPRNELARIWRLYSHGLQPSAPKTDIIGALLLANHIFSRQQQAGSVKHLFIFTDIRNSTRKFKNELQCASDYQYESSTIPSLRDVLGVERDRAHSAEWKQLNQFWPKYLQDSGARLVAFTVLREMPALGWNCHVGARLR